ncbi:MAG: hypothetical protein ABWW66_05595 [Archaeoglobaceae archaeon]
MYDLTRFYRAESPVEALAKLKEISKEILFDFAREPQTDDLMLKELWDFIKSWFSSYERLQRAARTRYGLMRKKAEGLLHHKPTLLHYFAATIFKKDLDELTKEVLKKPEWGNCSGLRERT